MMVTFSSETIHIVKYSFYCNTEYDKNWQGVYYVGICPIKMVSKNAKY